MISLSPVAKRKDAWRRDRPLSEGRMRYVDLNTVADAQKAYAGEFAGVEFYENVPAAWGETRLSRLDDETISGKDRVRSAWLLGVDEYGRFMAGDEGEMKGAADGATEDFAKEYGRRGKALVLVIDCGLRWAVVPGTLGLYEVSDMGDLRERDTGKIVKAGMNSKGYAIAGLSRLKPPRLVKVHTLVAEAFCPKPTLPPNESAARLQVDHIDGARMNNDARNLRWVTPRGNRLNARAERARYRTHAGMAIVAERGGERETFKTLTEAAEKVGVGLSTAYERLQVGKPTRSGWTLRWTGGAE